MIGKLLRMLMSLVVYVCVATVIAEGILLALLRDNLAGGSRQARRRCWRSPRAWT